MATGALAQVDCHLTLAKAISLASKENPQVFAANQRVKQAIANIAANRAGLLPQITGTLGGQRQTEDMRSLGIKLPGDPHVGPFNSFDMRGRLALDIFDPSALERLKSAQANEKLSQADFHKVRQDILAMVATMFLEAQRASQAVALNKLNVLQSELQYKVFQIRLNQGTGSVSDLARAKMDLAQSQYLLKVCEVHAEEARLDLAAALQIPLEQNIIFDHDESWMHKDLPEGINPDVALAIAQVNQSKAAVNEAKAGFLPKLTAAANYGRSGESPSASSDTYALGLSVTLPIWEGGLKQAQLHAAQSKLKENEVLLEDVKTQNQAKIKEARNNVEEARALLMARTKQLKYAEHQWMVAATRFKSGLGSQLEMSQAQATRALALDEQHEAQAIFLTAKVNLAHVLGRIEDMFDIQ